ncbi:MAG: acetamidase/formamidase family protein [Caldilineaceae bacterium]|nr:acetamidase/formamidase family protein [Caldilineaceae bacterium]
MAMHRFTPIQYFSTIGAHAPVLKIEPGDSVETTTVDAAGRDKSGEQVALGGNPMTGPFFIVGAEVGDTLAVHLDAITPNRAYGWGRAQIAPNVVDPDFVPQLPWPQVGVRPLAEWNVDMSTGQASLTSPATTRPIVLPIEPMLGCFGVAPAGNEAISTATSAQHGGNMDYRRFVAGTTAYFPVLTPGALFFLGDGHALQGDGEMAGTGVEISCDVRFTVDLRKGWTINWPRGENEEYIWTVGNARPLDQATQHATTEMIRWLMADYDMDAITANTLLGQVVEYDLGNMFDPAYTMVCKVAKRRLR